MRGLCIGLCVLMVACGSSEESSGAGGADAGGDAASGGAAGSGGGGAAGQAGTGGVAGSGAAGGGGTCSVVPAATTVVDPAVATSLSVVNDPPSARGIFDPDIEYPGGAPAGAMSYSAVISTHEIATRIAVSDDKGASWTYVAQANVSESRDVPVAPTSMRCPGGTCSGHWVNEVSALLYDPEDPDTSRQWKLYTHSYLVLPGDQLAYDLGHIALHVAPDPLGPWSTEGPALGWNSESVVSSQGAVANASSFAQTKDCLALTEPAALRRVGGVIDLAVGCATADSIRIELFRSLDHGKSYVYAGRLLDGADGLCIGGDSPRVNAADLFVAGGATYLLATPQAPTLLGFPGYRGCATFPLIAGGTAVERDGDGRPVVARRIDAPAQQFIGACTASEGASTNGYLVSMLPDATFPPVFHIYPSGVVAP